MRSLTKQAARVNGFSLIELLVVLSIFVLAFSLIPAGLDRLYAKSSLDAYAQEVTAGLRDCARQARQRGRDMRLDLTSSSDCIIKPASDISVGLDNLAPVFYADGTSNGQALTLTAKDRRLNIRIDKLTSTIKIGADA